MWIPTIPSLNAIHPVIIHFPIVLLLVVPVLVLLALILGKRGDKVALAALIVLLIGTIGLIAAVFTGHAAEHAVKAAGLINDTNHPVLHEHEQYAELTRDAFFALSTLFVVMVAVGAKFRARLKPWVRPTAYIALLILMLPALVLLADAADLGGRLVHKHSVHANITSADPAVVQIRADAVRQTRQSGGQAEAR